ncbi:Zinc finger protein 64-like protein, isoforms 1 and 2, partial [Armadillidium vulgare]
LRQWLDQLALVTGWNKLKCPICGKICSRSDKLKLHLRIHTGERPYCCTYCHHRSRTSDDLKRHIRTHTGERPYPCPFCPYRASDPSTIRSHKKHRHGDQMNAAAANASLTGASAATSSSSSPSTVPIAAIPSPLSERERKYVSSPVASLMADFASDSEDKDENASVRAVPKHTRKNLI